MEYKSISKIWHMILINNRNNSNWYFKLGLVRVWVLLRYRYHQLKMENTQLILLISAIIKRINCK
jgi:hypothetical protein